MIISLSTKLNPNNISIYYYLLNGIKLVKYGSNMTLPLINGICLFKKLKVLRV